MALQQQQQGDSTPTSRFQQRLTVLKQELRGIQRELARRDLVLLAHRTRAMVRDARSLLDSNVHVLFSDQPMEARHDLHMMLDAADNQIQLALAQDYQFEIIMQRLYMSSSLSEYVLQTMQEAIEELKRKEVL